VSSLTPPGRRWGRVPTPRDARTVHPGTAVRNRLASTFCGGALAVGLSVVAVGCGGSGTNTAGATAPEAPVPAGVAAERPALAFPNFRIAYDTGIDFLDPGLSYAVEATEILWNVYLPLIGYQHAGGPAGATLVPYLAEQLPKVSDDGLTYTITLRPGLRYSDGTHVRASDFGATIERDFKLDSPGVGFFSNIEGATEYSKARKGHISGIHADNASRTITIKLKAPQGDFMNILATQFAAPVPARTPARDQSTTPIPSTGPYMIQKYKPNKSAVLIRNPHFNPARFAGDVPAGNPDRITIDVVADPRVAMKRVIGGDDDWTFHQPPVDMLRDLETKYAKQYRTFIPANLFYFFMNTRLKPFNDLNVRKAVNYGIDRNELVKVFRGLAVPTENVLPPTYPQYRKINLYPYNLAKARQLVKESGLADTPIAVWNHKLDVDPKATQYLVQQLQKIGFTHVREKLVNSAIYWTTIGNQAAKAQIGFADWFQDYPHPLDWFDMLLNGSRITPTHNNNYGNVDLPAVNRLIAQLRREPVLTPEVNRRWARVDRLVAEAAVWAPFVNREYIDFFSKEMSLVGSCYTNHIVYQLDFALVCRK
jgi:peptide/nickel transport system substrate-binding protein